MGGQNCLVGSDNNGWGNVFSIEPGTYLFTCDPKYLYIGESLNAGHRINQHCGGGNRSTFLKNYAKYLYHSKSSYSIVKAEVESQNNVVIQSITVDIGRKELEEFGIVNLPTVLNRFHRGKRKIFNGKCVDSKVWDTIQDLSMEIIKESSIEFEGKDRIKWSRATPTSKPGLYKVWNCDELIYIGESTDVAERFNTHSSTTYFSALRRSIGTKLFDYKYIGKKKFESTADYQITSFLNSCKYAFIEVTFGRRELEEYLINKLQPTLNKKSKNFR